MRRKNRNKRATTFTKLLLFLLFAVPVLYLGISYATGQDGIANIKSMFSSNEKTEKEAKSYIPENNISASERDQIYQQIEDMKRQLREKNKTINSLEEKIATLEAELKK